MVESRVVGSTTMAAPTHIPADQVVSLRDLLERLVSEQLAGYDERRRGSLLDHVLGTDDLERGAATGRYAGRLVGRPAPALEDALRRAVEAFADGLILVWVDAVAVEELDAPLRLHEESRIRLVRLVALAGG